MLEEILGPYYQTPNDALSSQITRSWCFVCRMIACCNLCLCGVFQPNCRFSDVLIQAWKKSVLRNFVVGGRNGADTIKADFDTLRWSLSFTSPVSSRNFDHQFLLLHLCNVLQFDQHNHLFFFCLWWQFLHLCNNFCSLCVGYLIVFPVDFPKYAFCNVTGLNSVLRSWIFAILYHDKAAVLSLMEVFIQKADVLCTLLFRTWFP